MQIVVFVFDYNVNLDVHRHFIKLLRSLMLRHEKSQEVAKVMLLQALYPEPIY